MSEMVKGAGIVPNGSPTTSEERTWAALAHASTLFTMLIALPTGGLGGLLFVFAPYVIYVAFKDKSRYVAFHAAQAFALQLAGTLGLFLLILLGAVVAGVAIAVTVILSFILIGLVLIPIDILLVVILALVVVVAPFVLAGFSIVATIECLNGNQYRYPYVGRWVEDWLARQEVEPAPLG